MAANERFVRRARRLGRAAAERMSQDIHVARLGLGLSQAEVGRQVGMSWAKVGSIERADHVTVPLVDLVLVAAVVGLEVSVRSYPVGAPYRDRAHAALLERLRARLHPSLGWQTEVPLPNANDLRAWDAMISGADFRAGTEAETRARDGQSWSDASPPSNAMVRSTWSSCCSQTRFPIASPCVIGRRRCGNGFPRVAPAHWRRWRQARHREGTR